MSKETEIEEDDDYCKCEMCGDTYDLREGCEPTKYCDICAHKAVESLEAELTIVTKERDEAKAELTNALAACDNHHKMWIDTQNELITSNAKLRELEAYIGHNVHCGVNWPQRFKCTCGLDELKAKLNQGK